MELESFFAGQEIEESWSWSQGGAAMEYRSQWLGNQEADTFYQWLEKTLPWRQGQIQVYGREILTPRLECWLGDPDAIYHYSGQDLKPQPWPPALLELRHRLEAETKATFNSCLANFYRDGRDSVGWHADNEVELGTSPFVASISLGVDRFFDVKPKVKFSSQYGDQQRFTLKHGSLLLMSGSLQREWLHQVPKQLRVKSGRINLTFRRIFSR